MIAAQQWAAMERVIPDAREHMRRGEFVAINDWRREHIWQHGSRYSTPELLERATGEKLNAAHFIGHLKKRYGAN
jgi:carboxypeptidase Taq